MTPLHLASYSGNENVVRLLLNSAGVQVEAATTENVITSIILEMVIAVYILDWIIFERKNSHSMTIKNFLITKFCS